MTMHAEETAEVVVVGSGPVGLLLACELGSAGIRVLLLERQTTFDPRFRAPGITVRTVEALDRRGLLDPLIAVLERVVEPELMTGRAADGTLPDSLPIRQEVLEQVLLDRAVALGTSVRRGIEVTGIRQDESGVGVRAVGSDGTPRAFRGTYLVGCDGGRSVVRKSAGIPFHGGDTELVGYQAVVQVDDPAKLGREWRRTDRGVVAFALAPSRVVSIEFGGGAVGRTGPVTVAEVEASVRRTSGTDVRLSEPRSLTRFTGNCRIAEMYGTGRVLLAGDAAHVHPPFGGQGPNLGRQDAVNLGWKLAAVVRGRAPEGLLDSYHRERHPVAVHVVRNSRAAVAVLRPGEENTPLFELFYGELMRLDEVRARLRAMFSMSDLRYPVESDHPLSGTAAPNPLLRTDAGEVRLNELFAASRAVLLDLTFGDELRRSAAKWTDRVDVVAARTDAFPGVEALLIRPDGYIAEVWPIGADNARARCEAALTRWFGTG